jgi:tRNA (adenine22-N1)-methyltransferase
MHDTVESPFHPMPSLDDRLAAVASLIRSRVHADIGSDHGQLLKALLRGGRIDRGIAIENKLSPYKNSRRTLAGLDADVRFADGLHGLQVDEADSLSLCGMGGELIARILDEFPDRVPSVLVLQPNRRPETVRQWGSRSGFHLVDERLVFARRHYVILRFQRSGSDADPAYQGLDRTAAELFGPLLIARWDPGFVKTLIDEEAYLNSLPELNRESQNRLDALSRLLARRRDRS